MGVNTDGAGMSTAAKVAIAVAVVALVVAAAVVTTLDLGTDPEPEREAEAEAIIEQLYEAADLAAAQQHVVEDSVRTGPQTAEQTREILQTILAQPFEVEEVRSFTVRGEELVEVRVGQVRWCVREDDRVLVGCRIAVTETTAEVDTPDLTVIFSGVDAIADRLDAVVVVASETGDYVPLEGEPRMEVPDGLGRAELVDTALAGAAQQVSVPLDMLRAYPDAGALLAFEIRDLDDLDALDGAEITVTWEGVTVDVVVIRVGWLVG